MADALTDYLDQKRHKEFERKVAASNQEKQMELQRRLDAQIAAEFQALRDRLTSLIQVFDEKAPEVGLALKQGNETYFAFSSHTSDCAIQFTTTLAQYSCPMQCSDKVIKVTSRNYNEHLALTWHQEDFAWVVLTGRRSIHSTEDLADVILKGMLP